MSVKTNIKTKSALPKIMSNSFSVPNSKQINGSPKVKCSYSSEIAAFSTSKASGNIKGAKVR